MESHPTFKGVVFKPGLIEAIESMFSLCSAIDDNDLTTTELAEACKVAISGGHETAQIALVMMCEAVGIAFQSVEPIK